MPKVGMEEIRKEQVIEATEKCIVDKGLLRMSVKDIAAEGNLSTGIIYHYFRNKEDVLLNVLKASFRKSHEQVIDELGSIDSAREKLIAHIQYINMAPVDNPDFYAVILNYLGEAKYNPNIHSMISLFLKNLRSYVTAYLEDGVKEGWIAQEELSGISAMVIALGLGIGIQWTIDPTALSIEELGRMYQDMFLKFLPEKSKEGCLG